ncbi:MAG: serine/threonine-protein kinase [bacterium]|jgi:serine/threonine protein kinase
MDEQYFAFDFSASSNIPRLDPSIISKELGVDNLRFLGNGSFGETWAYKHGRYTYAVKIIFNSRFPIGRIDNEIEGLRRVMCDYVVKLFDCGSMNYKGRTIPYMKFEFIPGGDLWGHILNCNWPNHGQVLELAKGILTGLKAIHSCSLIHRDLKPENIILRNSSYSNPVIVDLGLIKILDLPERTIYPAFMGTRAYMAPEQIRCERAQKGTDLWAFGIILYILLCHKHPFYPSSKTPINSATALELLINGPPQLPSEIPEHLSIIVRRFLSPEIYKRGSIEKALQDIEEMIAL